MHTDKANLISFWRVVFTYIIMLLHLGGRYGYKTYWYIGVEFFFIVSGYLLAGSLKNKKLTPYQYTWNRIKRLYPEYLFAFILAAFFLIWSNHWGIKEFTDWFVKAGFFETWGGHYWLWKNSVLANRVTWYISVMVIAGLFLYTLIRYFKNLSISIIFPTIIIAYISFSYVNAGGVDNQMSVGTFGHINFLRGMAEMCMGILLFELNQNTEIFKIIWVKIIGILCLIFVITASFKYGGECDYLYIFLISIGIATGFNTKLSYGGGEIISFFDKISYSIYLNHLIFYDYIIPAMMPDMSIKTIVAYISSVTAFATFMHYFVNKIVKSISEINWHKFYNSEDM